MDSIVQSQMARKKLDFYTWEIKRMMDESYSNIKNITGTWQSRCWDISTGWRLLKENYKIKGFIKKTEMRKNFFSQVVDCWNSGGCGGCSLKVFTGKYIFERWELKAMWNWHIRGIEVLGRSSWSYCMVVWVWFEWWLIVPIFLCSVFTKIIIINWNWSKVIWRWV